MSPRAFPPLPQLFDDIAQVGPTILADPDGRGQLLPRSVVVEVFVMGVGVSFARVRMVIVVAKDGSVD